ncbi:hypothetical protein BDR26DRAFT_22478 [Obelidium mucronatum]|nr:hypothetical protein BDR26DRAFT_22478 [Obelidium mucronatum]
MRAVYGDSRLTHASGDLADKIPTEILHMNSQSAKTFRFKTTPATMTTTTAPESNWGPEECRHELLNNYNLSDKKVTPEWVSNHYRWIVWKLAAMVRSFPDLLTLKDGAGGWEKYWSGSAVVDQMLYRYQKEYCDARRSCLNLIIEGDRAPDSLLVLCVADVFVNGESVLENGIDVTEVAPENLGLELTDGWYSLKTQIDPVLCRALVSGTLRIGCKLMIYGAQVNGETGSRSALEAGDRLGLKISANGTRLAKWDAKLGYQARPIPFQVSIARVSKEGGSIPMIDAVVMRVYPMLFMENKMILSWAENEVQSRKHQELFAKECERLISKHQKSSNQDLDGSEIAAEARETIPERNVQRKLVVRICDVPPTGHGNETCGTALLTLWNPDASMLEMLREGRRVKVCIVFFFSL